MAQPYISIIIPAYNEATGLSQCLRSLQAQHHALPYEIIVVDNASTDTTAAIARSCGVHVLHERRKGVCAARQAGLEAAGGQVIISTDADCIYPPGWLWHIEQCFRTKRDVHLLVGTYRFADMAVPNLLLRAWERLALRVHYAFGWQLYASAANLAFRKQSFPGYDRSLGSGGDELYVVKLVRGQGRTLFDTTNPVITSARRLHKRFFATLMQDFGVKYIGGYFLMRNRGGARPGAVAVRDNTLQRGAWRYTIAGIIVLLCIAGAAIYATVLIGHIIVVLAAQPLGLGGIVALAAGGLSYALFWPTSQLLLPSPWRARTSHKIVALTFDDGPNNPYTAQIAAIIESYGGTASFFQCGQLVEKFPGISRALSDAGHTLGNHSFDHSFWKLWRPRALLRDLLRTNRALHTATGKQVRFFRSPWLAKTPIVAWAARRAGLMPIAGRFMALNEIMQPDGVAMARNNIAKIKPGSIIILHDSRETHRGDRTQTVNAVKELCKVLAADGYQFVSMDELY